jgi:hypothetical protein
MVVLFIIKYALYGLNFSIFYRFLNKTSDQKSQMNCILKQREYEHDEGNRRIFLIMLEIDY